MERLKQLVDCLSTFIEGGVANSGDIHFTISEACELRSFIEKIEKEISELEKVNNYNKSAKNYKEPENREIKGKIPTPKTKGNIVDHPIHYKSNGIINGKPLECIDVMEAVKGWYHTAIFCEMNALKYNWRLGQKDRIPTELGKIQWYSDKAEELWRNNLKWCYPKNQHTCAVIKMIKMKDPTTGKWSDAVLYTDGSGIYVRDSRDFTTKFERV